MVSARALKRSELSRPRRNKIFEFKFYKVDNIKIIHSRSLVQKKMLLLYIIYKHEIQTDSTTVSFQDEHRLKFSSFQIFITSRLSECENIPKTISKRLENLECFKGDIMGVLY